MLAPEEAVGALLSRGGHTLAVAESCTGGLLGGRITRVPGASDYFRGGVIAYANEAKVEVLGVRQSTLDSFGAVSADCAREMARGAALRLGADYALSVTGVAGPGGGSPEKPVGLVFLGLATPEGTRTRELPLSGTRDEIREATVIRALEWLVEELS